MAAYAALVSLSKVIDLALSQKQEYVLPYSREQMMSLHGELGHLQDQLEHLSGRSHPSIDVLESRIRDAAYQLEDIIEGDMYKSLYEVTTLNVEDDIPSTVKDASCSSLFVKIKSFLCLRSSPVEKTMSPVPTIPSPVVTTPSAFASCAREIDIFVEEAMAMKESNLQDKDTSKATHPFTTGSSSGEPPNANLDFNRNEIMDWIFGRSSNLEIVPITGMGGIGKTTLARAVYEHPGTLRHFDISSWVTVSQEFNVGEILRGLLPSEQQSMPHERLIESVHKRLVGRSYLIVLDDMWDVKAWDGVRNAFPDDNKGSRIILTTRMLDVAMSIGSSNHVHQMQFLNDAQGWDLLQEKVGRNAIWPKELEGLGKEISRNCGGLPLAVIAMAGVLKFNMTEEYWQRVAWDTKLETAGNYDDHLFDILGLSYTILPPYLKACFLYFGLFKEDEEISREELVRLWTAEGFLKPRGSKEMEDVAEEYLEELVARSLILVKRKWPDGRIKTCSIHDVLRDLSLRKAYEENFSEHITWKDRHFSIRHVPRRVSIDQYCFTKELDRHTHFRSLLFMERDDKLYIVRKSRLIRVLSKVDIIAVVQLSFIYEMTNLRYLHIYLRGSRSRVRLPVTIGESISKLQNLETLIFSGWWYVGMHSYELNLPSEIWEMPRLRHLILLGRSRLACPALGEISCSGLQTLNEVTNFDLTRSMTAKLSNLKKLILFYDSYLSEDKNASQLDSLVYLHQLEELTIACYYHYHVTDLSFPHKLKKLSLEYTKMPVENMSLIGSLPSLEVLKLKRGAVIGQVWEPIEGEFLQLKYLLMKQLYSLKEWRAESEHFPQLETLKIKSCTELKEVPAGIGEIDTLKKLVLFDCNKAAKESVMEIKSLQESYCNDLLQVIIRRCGD